MILLPHRLLAAANAAVLTAAVAVLATTASTAPAVTAAPPSDPRLAVGDLAARLADPDFLLGDERHVLEPGDFFAAQRSGAPGQPVPAGAHAAAVRAAVQLRSETARVDPALASAPWRSLGPTNLGGRVLDLAVDASEDSTLYVASASGGVWKSTDGGSTFAPSWPVTAPPSVGALAVGSDGTLFAGTGEAGPGGGSITYGGAGVFRSRDGGRTWQHVGLRGAGSFGRIVVDPKDPRRVFAAATGDLYRPGGQRGLYRSLDGGSTWALVLKGANATTGAVDVAIDPVDPRRVYATTWDRIRCPTHRVYGGRGSAVHRSLDGGRTWQRLPEPAGETPEDTGRIAIAVAPSQPDRIYAHVIATAGRHAGLFRSDDAGDSWQRVPGDASVASNSSTFGWWFGRLHVDPQNADRFFTTGVELLETRDAGGRFTAHSNTLAGVVTGLHQAAVHADQHAMVWHPRVAGLVYLGNDGGVYRSRAAGAPGSWVAGLSQGWTQHYSVGVSRQNPDRVVTGMQDNLCQRNYAAGVSRPDTWTKYGLCGDGLQTLINPENDRIVYGCSQYGSCSRSDDGGTSFVPLGGTTSDRRGWWTPLQFDPSDPDVMYYGGNVLNRSTDGGRTWTAISPDLSSDPEQLDEESGYHIYGVITWVAASPTDPKRLVVGTDEGQIWTTRDLGESWTRARAPSGVTAKAWVTRVAFDPANANTIYATYSGYRSGAKRQHVVRSTDLGRSWTDVSGNLPAAPVNELVVAPDRTLVVGTDVGVFLSHDGGRRWRAVGAGLPMVPVLDLDLDPATGVLTAATFGHGVMRVELPKR
jgi:photosystem II stability/assembly factor-like uncharacterized protein